MRIGIDLLGSDSPPEEIFPAILRIAEQAAPEATFVVFATPAVAKELCALSSFEHIEFFPVQEFISMSDNPLTSARLKKRSSLVVGMRLLKKKQLDAFVTAGNTGAMVACAALYGPMLPGIRRPALLAELPTLKDPLTVIDIGGNVTFKAWHLLQFAQMGIAYHRYSSQKHSIRVGLLNIGEESMKGTSELRMAYAMLQKGFAEKDGVEFLGNVEAREIFKGGCDVLVTDGFTGNILLKTSEGVSSFIFDYMRSRDPRFMNAAASELHSVFDHAEHPGAILCGVDGVVVKCHGQVTATSMHHAIQATMEFLRGNFIHHLKTFLQA